MDSDEQTEIGGIPVKVSSHRVTDQYEPFDSALELKALPLSLIHIYYDWQTTGKRVKIKDPIYHQDHTFEVWQVEIDGQIHRFAAGEFSNCVWGFYLKRTNERSVAP